MSGKAKMESIRVGDEDHIWKTLVSKWSTLVKNTDGETEHPPNQNQTIPKMVFSIIGDSDSFVPKPWPKSKFQSALITAAKNAGDSLIFYQGRETGISRVVYEALKERYRLDFYNDEGKRKKPKKGTATPLIQLVGITPDDGKKEEIKRENFEETVSKMPYDSICNYYNVLLEVEKTVSKKTTTFPEVSLDLRIPVLIVLLEGDTDAINHVKMAVENNLPVVIVQGTGKAADLIVECFECTEEDEIEKTLKRKAPLLFGTSFKAEILEKLIGYMDVIVKHQWLIHIFNIDTDDPEILSQIAGEAVICGWSMGNIEHSRDDVDHTTKRKNQGMQTTKPKVTHQTSDTGKMATSMDSEIKLNDSDLYTSSLPDRVPTAMTPVQAVNNLDKEKSFYTVTKTISRKPGSENTMIEGERRYVLDSKFMSPSSLPLQFYFQYQTLQEDKPSGGDKNDKYQRLLLEALKANRIDYIQVLLDDDIVIEEDQLQKLYSATIECESCDSKTDQCFHMQWILKQEDPKLAQTLLDADDDTVNSDSKESERVRKAAMLLCSNMLGYAKRKQPESKEGQVEKISPEQSIIEDLLLWSIYANRPKISEIIWQKTDNQLLSGVCCAVLLKHLSKKASHAKEFQLSESLANHSEAFQKRCLVMMDKMYEFDPKTTIKIVEDLATVWGITSSPMTFAYENKLYDIVAHIGCQKALNFKWYNDLPPETWAFFKSLCDTKNIKQCNFFRSPVFRFVINYLMFLTMLISYSSYVMTSIDDVNYTRAIARVWEYYTYIWAFGDFIEEAKRLFRGVFTTGDNSHRKLYIRFRQYIKDFWNLIDILSYILLIIALFVRHFYPSEDYNIARRLFSLSLLVMYLRFLEIFFISHRLGTQLLMIKEMLKDLIDFLYVMIIIIVGVGIYYHANLFPNHLAIFGPGSIETWSFWKVFYYPYWQLYGETFTEYLEGKDLSNCISNMTIFELDPSQERCPREEFSVPVVSAFYFLISNLLLVNLVIAKFSYTFDAVQTNSVKLWKYQRYTFVTDYESKIPSPFNLIFYLCPLYWILRCKKRSTCCLSEKQIKKTKKKKKMKREHRLEIQKIFAGRCINI